MDLGFGRGRVQYPFRQVSDLSAKGMGNGQRAATAELHVLLSRAKSDTVEGCNSYLFNPFQDFSRLFKLFSSSFLKLPFASFLSGRDLKESSKRPQGALAVAGHFVNSLEPQASEAAQGLGARQIHHNEVKLRLARLKKTVKRQ